MDAPASPLMGNYSLPAEGRSRPTPKARSSSPNLFYPSLRRDEQPRDGPSHPDLDWTDATDCIAIPELSGKRGSLSGQSAAYRDRILYWYARELLQMFSTSIGEIALIPSTGGFIHSHSHNHPCRQ